MSYRCVMTKYLPTPLLVVVIGTLPIKIRRMIVANTMPQLGRFSGT